MLFLWAEPPALLCLLPPRLSILGLINNLLPFPSEEWEL